MAVTKLKVENFGPIKSVDVSLGDLNILIGPQASGKSLFLELFKLVMDKNSIIETLRKYNYILSKTDVEPLLDYYFGEGLHTLFSGDTKIEVSDKKFAITDLLKPSKNRQNTKESVFYVPAQRILGISDGRPKNFMEFDGSAPYVLKNFSETLRVFIQSGLGNPDVIFPMRNRLKGVVKNSIDESVFHGAKVVIDQSSGQRKMKLNINNVSLPFMTWSAGQKEFMPLLLAMYCLSGPPTSVINKEDYKWVIIEEPEMGLHPRAIQTVIWEIIELIQAGYKVIVSTHSPTLLEFAWVFESLKNLPAERFKKALSELFDIDKKSTAIQVMNGLQEKELKTYFFSSDGGGVISTDISSLDVENDNPLIAEWGGLSAFSGKASEVVGKYYQEPEL